MLHQITDGDRGSSNPWLVTNTNEDRRGEELMREWWIWMAHHLIPFMEVAGNLKYRKALNYTP